MATKLTTAEVMRLIPYTQQEIADMIGVNQGLISQYVTGRHCSARIAYALAKLAGISPEEVLEAGQARQAERRARAQARLAKLGLDLTMPPAEEATDPQAAK